MIAILAVGVALAGLMLRSYQGLDKRMDGVDERLRSLETGQAELKGAIHGKLDLIEHYIIARNLLGDDPAPQTSGADEWRHPITIHLWGAAAGTVQPSQAAASAS